MNNREAIGQSPAPAEGCPKGCEANAKLEVVMLATQNLSELYALMEDYSYKDVMAVYNQFTPSQQAKFNQICFRDTQAQLDAISIAANSVKSYH
ncbi:MAG: hypothetical protein WBG73_05850 [Coleofasciculaceae cyanobacterium]